MAANGSVIDELVVKLTLDADEYEKKEKNITVIINKTEKQLTAVDKKRKERDNQQNKRWKESTKAVKEFGNSLGKLALTVGSVLGVGGGVGGLIAAVTALAGFETNLRKTGVSTGLSNRELQAYGSTIKRLGGDAEAGTQAIAALAKEQKQFALTGNAPTLQAFQRIGVNAGPNSNIVDVLAEAQQRYRAAPEGQRSQMENVLSASGVSPDLIVAIKSEKDVREAFTQSLAESTTENRKALDGVSDAMEAVKNAALNLANSIASIAMPYIEQFAKFASNGAQTLSQFADKVAAAGGGLDGLYRVLDRENPELAQKIRAATVAFNVLAESVNIIVFGFQKLGEGLSALGDWVNKITGVNVTGGISDWFKQQWNQLVQDAARATGEGGAKLSAGAAARTGSLDEGEEDVTSSLPPTRKAPTPAGGARGNPTANDLIGMLIKRGFSLPEAAGIVANIEGESTYNPAAVNNKGGGNGAHGYFQYRGDRLKAFQTRYGKLPSQATPEEQLDFATSGAEGRQLRRSLAGGTTAGGYAAGVNNKFEVNGVVGEAARRATRATQLQAQYPGSGAQTAGPQININGPVTVQANQNSEFVNGVQRVSGITNYNTATR
jgi:hypothetical protein